MVPAIMKFRVWLQKYLLWNFIIRLFIEMSMLLAFCCLLTIKYAVVTGLMGWANFISAWVFLGVLVLLPFFILFFYLKNFDLMNNDDEKTA